MDNGQHQIVVSTADFDQHQVYTELVERVAGQVGAVVTFVGLVRDYRQSPEDVSAAEPNRIGVQTLTLEHYPGMTEKSIKKIVEQACERWPLLATHVIHRVGELKASEQIVMVAVASGHRGAAFAAAEFIMDYLKTDAVFWKKEQGEQGARWIESTAEDHQRQQQW